MDEQHLRRSPGWISQSFCPLQTQPQELVVQERVGEVDGEESGGQV